MIGNDLVDLQQALRDSNWMRRGFLSKLFSKLEQLYIMLASEPFEMVWLLWSMKEAAYKIYNRDSGLREYAPARLNCKLISISPTAYLGQVRINGCTYHTKGQIFTGNYVHSVASTSSFNLDGIKVSLYPLALNIDYKAMKPACVSHHGRYLALIF